MPNIVAQCPSCSHRYKLAESAIGKRANCGACKQSFVVAVANQLPTIEPMPKANSSHNNPKLGSTIPKMGRVWLFAMLACAMFMIVGVGAWAILNRINATRIETMKFEAVAQQQRAAQAEAKAAQATAALEQAQNQLKELARPIELPKAHEKKYKTFEEFWSAVLVANESRDALEPIETEKEKRLLGGLDRTFAENVIRQCRAGEMTLGFDEEAVRLGLRAVEKRYKRMAVLNNLAEQFPLKDMIVYTWSKTMTPESVLDFAERCDLQTRAWTFARLALKDNTTNYAERETALFIRSLPGGREWWDARAK
jgi:hypothetical protein